MVHLKLAAAKPLPATGKVPFGVGRNEFQFVHSLGIGSVGLDIVVEIPTGVLVENHVEIDELAIHIFRLAIGPGHAARGDDDGADQTALHAPHSRASGRARPANWDRRARARALRHLPGVDVGLSRRDVVVGLVVAGGAVVVAGALGILVIEDAVRMHAGGMGGVVLEDHADGVAHFGAQDRPENSGMLPLRRARLQLGEGLVGVFAIDGLAIDGADAMRTLFGEDFGIALELHAHHLVHAVRGRSSNPLRRRRRSRCELCPEALELRVSSLPPNAEAHNRHNETTPRRANALAMVWAPGS